MFESQFLYFGPLLWGPLPVYEAVARSEALVASGTNLLKSMPTVWEIGHIVIATSSPLRWENRSDRFTLA